jgi:hypothetical protein
MAKIHDTRICASPGCGNAVTNPQSGYCNSCNEFDMLIYDLETPRFEQELAEAALARDFGLR